MTDTKPNISDAAVEAACIAGATPKSWSIWNEDDRNEWRESMVAPLQAAYPHLRDQIIEELALEADAEYEEWDMKDHDWEDVAAWLRSKKGGE